MTRGVFSSSAKSLRRCCPTPWARKSWLASWIPIAISIVSAFGGDGWNWLCGSSGGREDKWRQNVVGALFCSEILSNTRFTVLDGLKERDSEVSMIDKWWKEKDNEKDPDGMVGQQNFKSNESVTACHASSLGLANSHDTKLCRITKRPHEGIYLTKYILIILTKHSKRLDKTNTIKCQLHMKRHSQL